jgi:hypothetical protein
MHNLTSRMKLHMKLGLAVLAIVGSAALTTPASAAKQSGVVKACKDMGEKCAWFPGINGGGAACTARVCAVCTKGTCVQGPARVSDGGRLKYKPGARDAMGNLFSASGAKANDTLIHRGNIAPVKLGASTNNHMRMSGHH